MVRNRLRLNTAEEQNELDAAIATDGLVVLGYMRPTRIESLAGGNTVVTTLTPRRVFKDDIPVYIRANQE